MYRFGMGVLVVLLSLSAPCKALAIDTEKASNSGFLRVSNGALDIDGAVPELPSVNMFDLVHLYMTAPASGQAKLARARAAGFRMVRFFAAGTYNEATTRFPAVERWKSADTRASFFAAYDQLVQDAKALGIVLVPALVTGYYDPDERLRPSGSACARYPFSLPMLPGSENRAGMKSFALDLVNRYRDSRVVLFWELTNEGNLAAKHKNPQDLCVTREQIRDYFDELAAAIKTIDGNHLIATGAMQEGDRDLPLGDVAGTFNDAGDYFRYYNASPNVDIVTVHLYSQFDLQDVSGRTLNAGEILRYFNGIAVTMGKPLWIGEFGVPGGTAWSSNNLHDTPMSIFLARHYLGIDLATAWNWESREYGRPDYHPEMVQYSIDPGEDNDIIHVLTSAQDVMGANDARFHWKPMTGDFNGDGRSDLLAASDRGTWQVSLMGDSPSVPGQWFSEFGDNQRDPGAAPFQRLTGDFNGDGITDIAVKGQDGRWFVALGDGRKFGRPGEWLIGFGNTHSDPAGDFVAIAGDWNGDGLTDIGMKARDGRWYVAFSDGSRFRNPALVLSNFLNENVDNGGGGVHVLSGDWNGDGRTDLGAKTSDGRWYMATSTGTGFTYERLALANLGNDLLDPAGAPFLPVVGDWNGDGKADVGVKSRDGRWFLADGDGLSFIATRQVLSGFGDDLSDPGGAPFTPFAGDWNKDGRTDIGIHSNDGRWFIGTNDGSTFVDLKAWH